MDDELVEIIDVEKILSEISPVNIQVSQDIVTESAEVRKAEKRKVLIADDSAVARSQVRKTVEQLDLETITVQDGREAYDTLMDLAEDGVPIEQKILLVISDIEMPEMDGYTLTAEIRSNPKLASLHILLHTSLSGVFNQAMVEKVGADDFIAKFNPDDLATAVKSLSEL